jgi:hydrogenase maturation protease
MQVWPTRGAKVLVLRLGNEIMGDDAVGLLAARELKARWGRAIEVVEASIAGFALLDLLEGYERVLIIDSIATGSSPPGSIVELSPDEFQKKSTFSPHFVGLNDVIGLAEKLEIPFPSCIRILGMEVEDPFIVREGVSETIADSLEDMVARAETVLFGWGIAQPADLNGSNMDRKTTRHRQRH